MTTARLAIGNDKGMVIFYDSGGKIISAYAYPHYDGRDGDWGYAVYQVSKTSDTIVTGDEDWDIVPFVDSTTLRLRNFYLDEDRRDDYHACVIGGIGDETWVFAFHGTDTIDYRLVKRFDSQGNHLGDLPISHTDFTFGTPDPATHWNNSFGGVCTWDYETFYLLEGQSEPRIWRWVAGSDPVLLGSIWNTMKAGHSTADGECRQIAMHGPDQLIATSFNVDHAHLMGPIGIPPSYGHVVLMSLPALTVVADYSLMDLALAGSIEVFVPRTQPNTLTPGGLGLFPFACSSDGTYIWTGDFQRGEIWRINPETGAIDLWNTEVFGRFFNGVENEYRPSNPTTTTDVLPFDYGPLSLNARDFIGFSVPPVQHDQAYQVWPVFTPFTGAPATSGVRFDTRH